MAGVPHGVAEPEDVPPQVAVLPDQVIAAARALAQALGVLRRRPRRHRGAGGEVRVEQEAAGALVSTSNTWLALVTCRRGWCRHSASSHTRPGPRTAAGTAPRARAGRLAGAG